MKGGILYEKRFVKKKLLDIFSDKSQKNYMRKLIINKAKMKGVKVKKLSLWLMIVMITVTMIGLFSFSSCKGTTAETTAAASETTAAASETAAAETTAAATVVAAEEETYIFAGGWWAYPVWQQLKYGVTKAAEYWNAKGDPIKVEFVGPMEGDMDQIYAGLEAAIAKNPTGIIYLGALALNEGPIIQPYLDSGGMVWCFGGTGGVGWTATGTGGTDNSVYGELLGKKAIELAGENAKVGIQTIAASPDHQARVAGIKRIFANYPNVKILQEMEEGASSTEGTANAAAFIAANPDFDIMIGTGSLGGTNTSVALKEAGIAAGEKKVLCGDISDDILKYIREGYITATLAQQFASEGFYAITVMHLRKLDPAPLTSDDKKTGFLPGPINLVEGNFWVDQSNIDLFGNLNAIK